MRVRLVGSGLSGSPVWGGFLSETLLPSLRKGNESGTGVCGQCGFRSDVDVLSESAIGVKFTGDEMRPRAVCRLISRAADTNIST